MPVFDKIHRRLEGLGIVGICPVQEEHDTDAPASFHTVGSRIIRLDWDHEPTNPQKTQAGTALSDAESAYEFNEWRPKEASVLLNEIDGLSNADQQKLLKLAAVDLLQRQPDLARSLGIEIDADEPVPG